MKKLLTVLAVMFLFAGTSAFATGIYLAPKANMSYGFGDIHDDTGWEMNPGIGAGLILGWDIINRQIAIEDYKETENELSLYAGAEFELAQDLLFRPQFFYIDFEDDASYQVKLEFAYRFSM